jgi:hypothetical protein
MTFEYMLGKQPHERDDRTLMLSPLIDADMPYPPTYDLDKGRVPFPSSPWGNDAYGNCVKGGQANQTIRLERVERHTTPKLTDDEVIEEYKAECLREFGAAPQSPGDANDNGLIVLRSLRNWKNIGWDIYLGQRSKVKTNQRIFAYGYLTSSEAQLRRACLLFRGVQFGINLPLMARQQISRGQPWDVVSTSGDGEPGSWGGHLVYSCHYDQGGFYVMTWGMKQYVTNAFLHTYADERWAVVDAQDPLKTKSRWLDVDAMMSHLREIGAVIDQ